MTEPTLGEMYVLLREMRDDVKKIDTTLNGNGREGLVVRVVRHETWLKLIGSAVAITAAAFVGHFVSLLPK